MSAFDAAAYASASTTNPGQSSAESLDELISRLRVVLDSRILAVVDLVCLLVAVVGLNNFVLLIVLLFAGYVLLDRFVSVRRAVIIGGTAWFLVLLAGNLLVGSVGPIYLSIDYLFMFCGFLLAVALCASFSWGARCTTTGSIGAGRRPTRRSPAIWSTV